MNMEQSNYGCKGVSSFPVCDCTDFRLRSRAVTDVTLPSRDPGETGTLKDLNMKKNKMLHRHNVSHVSFQWTNFYHM